MFGPSKKLVLLTDDTFVFQTFQDWEYLGLNILYGHLTTVENKLLIYILGFLVKM